MILKMDELKLIKANLLAVAEINHSSNVYKIN